MSLELAVTLGAVFVLVSILAVWAGSTVSSQTAAGRRRLHEAAPVKHAVLAELVSQPAAAQVAGWVGPLKMFARSKKEMSRLRARLFRAGYTNPAAPFVYAALETSMPVVVGLAVVLALGVSKGWIPALLAALVVFFTPSLFVERAIALRRKQIEQGLPDALDLLVVCMEAGSGLDQAIAKTSKELMFAYPALATELKTVITEIRAGKARMDAFKSLAHRTKVDDVRALVAMLAQTDRFGTSVGQALRTHADTSRIKRGQVAEERAQKLGVKLVFPLVLCFFPSFFVVVLGPAVIHFVRDFTH
jgi:tight adherence protein C